MAKHRTHSIEVKRQVAQDFIAGETLHGLAKRSKDRGTRTHGRQGGPRNRVSKGGAEKRTAAEKRKYIRLHRPYGISVAEGCRLMGLPRSTYYDAPPVKTDDAEIVANITAICDEFEAYGYPGLALSSVIEGWSSIPRRSAA